MAWKNIPGTEYWEYDDNPPDPGGAQTELWEKQFNGVRVNTVSGHEIYTKCRMIGTTVDTAGELNKTYYDNVYIEENGSNPFSWNELYWINLDWLE